MMHAVNKSCEYALTKCGWVEIWLEASQPAPDHVESPTEQAHTTLPWHGMMLRGEANYRAL